MLSKFTLFLTSQEKSSQFSFCVFANNSPKSTFFADLVSKIGQKFLCSLDEFLDQKWNEVNVE